MDTAPWNPTTVSFGGGGARAMGHFGVLATLLSSGTLENVRDWYGSSAGTLCALIGALGCSPQWIRDLMNHLDLSPLADIDVELVSNFMEVLGVASGDRGFHQLKQLIDSWESGISGWTFADLAAKRPGIFFHVIATNMTTGTLAVFNARNTPDILIYDAIRASCAIPLYYTPWKDKNGDLYCDGAIIEIYPWHSIVDKEHTLVVVCSERDISGRPEKKRQIANVVDYVSCLVNIVSKRQSSEPPRHWIAINNCTIGPLDFHITAEERIAAFEEGAAAATAWEQFRRKVLASETHGIRLPSVGPRTSPSCRPSPNRRLGIHQSCDLPSPPPYSSLGSRSEGSPRGRRWSL